MKASLLPAWLLWLCCACLGAGRVEGAVAISAVGNVVVPEDTPTGAIAFSVTGFQTRNPTVSAVSDNSRLVGKGGIVLSGLGGSWTITVTPTANETGVANITITATDGFSTDTELFSVTVRAVNDAPTVSDIGNQTINEDTTGGPYAFTIDDPETAAGNLVITTSSSNTDLVGASGIVLGGSGNARTISVTPRANLSGTTVIGIFVSDGSLTGVTRFTLTVLPVNDPPAVSALGNQKINEDTVGGPYSFSISDPETSVANLVVTAVSSNPSLVSANGIALGTGGTAPGARTITVTPMPNQVGTTTLSVRVSDGSLTTTEEFELTVVPVNDAPTISDIADLVLAEDVSSGPLPFTVGDIDNDPGTLTLRGSTSNSKIVPESNIVFGGSGANRTVTVTPLAEASGPVTITVTVTDGTASAADSFSIRITPVNDPPSISEVADRAIAEDSATGPIPFVIGDVDSDLSALTVQVASGNTTLVPSANLVLGGQGANRTLAVTPVANLGGTATITLTVSDGAATSTESFILRVDPVNDAPTLSSIRSQSIPEDGSTGPIAFTVADIDNDPGTLVVEATSGNPNLLPLANIVFGGGGSSRTVTVTPAPNQSGTVLVTLTVSDGAAKASTEFNVQVSPVNDPPTISDIANQSINENGTTGAIAFTVGDPDNETATLTVQATSGNTALVPNANVVLGGSGANRTITVTPAANQSGTAVFTVTVSDGSASAADRFTVTVGAVNDPPTISDIANQSISEDGTTGAIAFTVGDADNEAATLTVQATSGNTALVPNANVVLGGSGANRTITVTPAANQSGTALITVTVSDGSASAADQFTVTVGAVNDPPTISDIANQSISEDGTTGAIAFTVGDADNEAATLTVVATSGNTALVPNANVVLGGSGANRTITVTPAANQSGTAVITVTVSDGSASAADQFTVTVGAVNDPPTISDIANQSISEDGTTGAIAFTVGDPDNEAATLTVVATSGNTALVPSANVVLGGSGANRTIAVTPAANQSGTALITVTVSDGSASAADQFTVTVGAVNDPPTISDIADQGVQGGGTTGAIPFTVEDTETAAALLVVTATSSNPTLVPPSGIVLGGEGSRRTIAVTPVGNTPGTATVRVTVSDGELQASDSFTVSVTASIEAPKVVSIPLPVVVYEGETATFSVGVTGTSPFNFQWFFNDQEIRGANEQTLVLRGVTPEQAGLYRVRVSNSAGSVTSAAGDLTVQRLDYGDAPESSLAVLYHTKIASKGPRHRIVPGFFLGRGVDGEVDGQPTVDALGDDVSPGNFDDEDGVEFATGFVPGQPTTIIVTSSTQGVLDAWFDFNRAGGFESGEHAINRHGLVPGSNTIVVNVPTTAMAGDSFARFRLSRNGVETPDDLGSPTAIPEGEVEDYRITIVAAVEELDFGDAPEGVAGTAVVGYPTTLQRNGARHVIVKGFHLGKTVDGEADGKPSADALGDDGAPQSLDDEDGVEFSGPLVAGQTLKLTVTASASGRLDAWVDFDQNRSWGDAGEQIFQSVVLATGPNSLSFAVPASAKAGLTFARFRFSKEGKLGFVGQARDGEVEDYRVPVESNSPCDTDYLGREFWLAFPGNYVPSSANQLRLTLCVMGPPGATGTVAVPGLRFAKDFVVPASRSVEVTLPDGATLGDDVDVVRNRGIRVSANVEVAVFGLNRIPFSADGFLGLPVDTLGREYLVVGYPNVFDDVGTLNGTQFAVVATEDETEVTIVPSRTVLGHPKGEPFLVQLKEGQAYQLRDPDDATADLTGTEIYANKPVAVFGGHQCANVNSPSKMYCDYLVEQLLPVAGWARIHYLAPLATRSGGDTVRIVAAHDNTSVVVGALNLGTIDRGEVITYNLTGAIRLDASRPVHVTQVARSSDHDGVKNADPLMIAVPPVRFATNQHWVCAGPQVYGSHYIQVIGPAAISGGLTLDGAVVPAGQFAPIGVTGFSFARLAVGPGPHVLSASLAFTTMVYGWGPYESYGWPGGMRFGDITAPSVVCPPDFEVTVGVVDPKTGAASCTATVPDLSEQAVLDDNCGFPTRRVVIQDPQPGTQVGVGQWPIRLTVFDAAQNEAECTVIMTVVDRSQPSLICPKDFTVVCNKGAGARVAYQVVARRPCGATVAVECHPAPGAVFLPGTTVVECHVKDAPEVKCSFRVTVVCPPPGNRNDITRPASPVLRWTEGDELETALSLDGPWTPVPEAVSPFVPALIGDRQFFRVRRGVAVPASRSGTAEERTPFLVVE